MNEVFCKLLLVNWSLFLQATAKVISYYRMERDIFFLGEKKGEETYKAKYKYCS